jgi:GT2 family glycosyltransferase
MKVLIVIVNYKTAALTVNCLASLAAEVSARGDTRVVVADGCSGDGSIEMIQQTIEKNQFTWATLLPLPKNGGFAWANNQAMEPWLALDPGDRPDYVYLLNPDTLAKAGAVSELVEFMDAHPEVGITGGRSIDENGEVLCSAFQFHTPWSELESSIRLGAISRMLRKHIVAKRPPDQPARCDWVAGASMMIRRNTLEKIGLLDDRYFMYYEETDFCLRAAKAGFETWYVPASRIVHLVGRSSGVTGKGGMLKRRPRYWFDSRHRYFKRNYGAVKTAVADMLFAMGLSGYGVMRALRCKPRVDPPWLLWDFIRYNFSSWIRRA